MATQNPLLILPLVFLQAFSIELFELPGTYLFRQIRCDEYRLQISLPDYDHNDDICRLPAVQKKYTTDLAIYMGLLSLLAILVSSPYARLSDAKSRKLVIAIAAAITTLGEIWLLLCAGFAPLRRPIFIYFAAVIKGLGGSYSVMKAAEMAIIAENSSVQNRSFYLGLILVMSMAAAAVAPLISGVLVDGGHYVATFSVGLAAWIIHLLYLTIVIREPKKEHRVLEHVHTTQPVAPQLPSQSTTTTRISSAVKAVSERAAKLLLEPLYIIASKPTLRLLGLVDFMMMLATGAFIVLIVWSDRMFGLIPSEAGVISATMSVSRAFSVLCILPLVKVLYRRVVSEDSVQLDVAQSEPLFGTRESTEDSPRAEVSNDANADASNAPSADVSIEDTLRAQKARKLSAKQELLICRVCFLIDTLGMLLVSVSKSPTQVSIAVAIGSLGAPAVPSLQTLTTLASPPSELGRVLAALSIIESAVLALRSPILFGIYNLTLGSSPEVVWWCSAALLLVCGLAMQLLKPARFLSGATR